MNGAGTRVAMEPLRRFVEIAQSKAQLHFHGVVARRGQQHLSLSASCVDALLQHFGGCNDHQNFVSATRVFQ